MTETDHCIESGPGNIHRVNFLSRQCLSRRIPGRDTMVREVVAWQWHRNASAKPVDWRFRTEDARIKLKSLLPINSMMSGFQVLNGRTGLFGGRRR